MVAIIEAQGNAFFVLAYRMTQITKNFQLGFGSFVDKKVMPFVDPRPEKYDMVASLLDNFQSLCFFFFVGPILLATIALNRMDSGITWI